MKSNCCTILSIIVFACQFSLAQQMPIDFSNSLERFSSFNGSGFSFNVDPLDSGNDVGQFFNNGTNIWQGFTLDLVRPIDLDFQKTITLSFYSFDPNNHNVILKLEKGVNADVEVTQTVSSSGGWIHNITFDFSNAFFSGTSTPVNATGAYDKLTIFIDGGIATSGTYLIDDLDDGSTETNPNTIDVEYTDLVWADEFETDGAVNSSHWFHQTQLPMGGSWFNGEEQHYTDRIENSFVDSGFLNIKAIKENFTDQGETKPYTSTRLNSKFAFTYGRVDVRAKLPLGDGTWPAIWTLGKNVNEDGGFWDSSFGTVNWPACGEIDIMEHGLGVVNQVSSALHTSCVGCSGNTMNTQSMAISDVANNFHVYSINWSPDQIIFLVDGVGFYTYNPTVKNASTWPFFADQYILLNVAMGGIAGTISPSFTESSMVIDYVRVYQNIVLSADEINAYAFKVYPNPASTQINITSNQTIDKVELYNIIGNLILDKSGNVNKLEVSSLNRGIYLLKIYSGTKEITKKLVIN